ncbi:hypothetical protein [Micromonospora sp. NBRC 101691]|uniref:hypothetical protein n=1 Tax=Micromonospora sp. NBRC 101691 TaxID=3032198 RepID=UPI0024A17748|nr:hypothetical protein [Micromonospora sp. NBRC 101691]GLY22178.1 hypothetical protein Misp04_19100 [Micromonospora sp. NBRC 101691]
MIHEFRINGRPYGIDADLVRARLSSQLRENIRDHWVEVDGVRWPVKQAFGATVDLPRDAFTSHTALRHLQALGFQTSRLPAQSDRRRRDSYLYPGRVDGPLTAAAYDKGETTPAEAFSTLLAFFNTGDLTSRIARIEADVEGADKITAAEVAGASGLGFDVLHAALLVRKHAGRLNDIIHAAVIMQALPLILEAGEHVLRRPSLAAGNDPGRKFDLETDRRVAEFKMAVWKGRDTMRKRGVFADLVHLTLAGIGRRAQLYVSGPLPINYLRTSEGSAAWALGRSSPRLRQQFEEQFGSLNLSVRALPPGTLLTSN